MNEQHPSESELLWHFYGESAEPVRVQRHVDSCARCREVLDDYGLLRSWSEDRSATLAGEADARRIWEGVRRSMPLSRPPRLVPILLAAALVALPSFWIGRTSRTERRGPPPMASDGVGFTGATCIRPVKDVGRAVDWYCGRLGLRLLRRDAFAAELSAPASGLTLYLFLEGRPGCPYTAALRGTGSTSALTLDVEDVTRACERLAERGVMERTLPGMPSSNHPLFALLHDPDGNALLLRRPTE